MLVLLAASLGFLAIVLFVFVPATVGAFAVWRKDAQRIRNANILQRQQAVIQYTPQGLSERDQKQAHAVEWFLTGAGSVGFVWLTSASWPACLDFFFSWRGLFALSVAVFFKLLFSNGIRSGKSVLGRAVDGVDAPFDSGS